MNYIRVALIIVVLMAIAYAHQPTNNDQELAETKIKKQHSYEGGHYGGYDGYSSYGGYGKSKKHKKHGKGKGTGYSSGGYDSGYGGHSHGGYGGY